MSERDGKARRCGADEAVLFSRPALLLVVLALSVGARLWAIQHARFDRDEARFWSDALAIARGGPVPGLGIQFSASEATTPGPAFLLVVAAFQWFWADPRAAAGGFALLNVAALWLLYAAVKLVWSRRAAQIAVLLAGASPWLVYHSDRIWTPNLFVPMGAATLWSLARLQRGPHPLATALLVFVLLAGLQVHVIVLHLWILSLVVFAIHRPRPSGRGFVAGLALAGIAYLPYLRHELTTGFANTQRLAALPSGRPRSLGGLADLLYHFLAAGTSDVSFLATAGFWHGFDALGFWAGDGPAVLGRFFSECGLSALHWTVLAASVALLIAGLVSLARPRGSGPPGFLRGLYATALVSIALLYLASGRGSFLHYISPLLPLACLPAVAVLHRLAGTRGGRTLVVGYLLAFNASSLLLLHGYYRRDSLQSIPQQKAIVAYVLERSGGGQFELHFGWERGQALSYGLLARELLQARWPASERAQQVFTVMPRSDLPRAKPPGRLVDALELETLAVLYSRK